MLRDGASSSRPIPRRHSVSLHVVVVVVGTFFYFRTAHCITWLAEEEQKERTGENARACACTTYHVERALLDPDRMNAKNTKPTRILIKFFSERIFQRSDVDSRIRERFTTRTETCKVFLIAILTARNKNCIVSAHNNA